MKFLPLVLLAFLAIFFTGCSYHYKTTHATIVELPGDGRWGYLGYECYDLTRLQLDERRVGLDYGVGVWSVYGKPAVEMGMQCNDTVLEVNGRKVNAGAELYRVTRSISPGGSVSMLVLREGKEILLQGRTTSSPVQHTNSFELTVGAPEKFHWADIMPLWFWPGYFRIGPKFASLFEYDGGDHAWEGAGVRYLFFFGRSTRVDVDGVGDLAEH
jgi:hypothetical protein